MNPLASKDIRSALISLVSALLTWATEALTAYLTGQSLAAFLPAVMGLWAVAVNAIQTRVRDWLEPPSIPPVAALLLPMLLIPSFSFAAVPRAIITGPSTGTPGEFLTLDAMESEGSPKHYKWSISPELKGRKQIKPEGRGERCTVATFPGSYVVTLAISNEDGIDSITWQVTIPGTPPCPPPEPQPTPPQPVPTPTPVPTPLPIPTPIPVPVPIPDGEFKISTRVADIVSKIPSVNRISEAKSLADAADALAAQVAAGTVTNATEVLTRVGAGIKATNSPAWVAAAPEFAKLLQETWTAHSKGRLKLALVPPGGIIDPAGWSTLLREVAIGARAAK